MTLVISDIGTEAVMGTGPFRQKLYRLEWILEKLIQENTVGDYVLLDGSGPATGKRDDGRVVVAAALARTPKEIAAEAQRRAQLALERAQDERLMPNEQEDEREVPATVSSGVRPAVGTVYLDEKEEAQGEALGAEQEEE